MDPLTLHAATRTTCGSRASQYARHHDRVPAVVYGHTYAPVGVTVAARELHNIIHQTAGETVLIQLSISGDKPEAPRTVIIKAIQHDPVQGTVTHVDFQQISLEEKIHITVPIHTKGEPVGVRQADGILEHFLRGLDVRCLPAEIPHAIELDVSALNIGDTIHVKDLPTLASTIEVLTEPETPVVSVVAPRVEAEPELTAEEAAAEPEVIAKGKEDEEGAAAGGAAEAGTAEARKDDKKATHDK